MANKSLFGTLQQQTTTNAAGGSAYAMSAEHALAQLAVTGCLNSTFYTDAQNQLDTIMDLAQRARPEFVAKVALYARVRGHMKDAPALLVAILSVTAPGLMAEVFDRVIDSPKMLRNFVQIMRSGQVARRSLGSLPKRLVEQWLERRSDAQVFRASVGGSPSLVDVIRMVHPKPATPSRSALYAYLLGRAFTEANLPEIVKQYEAFKHNPGAFASDDVPDVPMELLTSLNLSKRHWAAMARRVSWQTLRMNLNTFTRHGAFESKEDIAHAASRLRDRELIAGARVFPFQLLSAFMNTGNTVPLDLLDALQDAMEIATERVPAIRGDVWVLTDVSGSMDAPVTGHRAGSTTKVRCVDVAALIAASVMRTTRGARVLAFSDDVVPVRLNARDTVMTNAKALASLPRGGTNCSAPLRAINDAGHRPDVVIFVSDNESWIDSRGAGRSTATTIEWERLKKRCPGAKLVCIDIQPNTTTQARSGPDVLNVGGFSDAVFGVVSTFLESPSHPEHWIREIEKESI